MSYKGRDRRLDEVPNTNDPKLLGARVFAGNLPTDKINRQEIEEKFSKYGKLLGLSMHRGFAFIQYEYEEDALEAVKQEHGGLLKGSKVDVNIATNKPRRDRDDKMMRPSGRRRSPFDDRRRDFRDRSPRRDGNVDDRQKRFVRDDRFRDERPREPFSDGINRRYEDVSMDRRFDNRDDGFKYRPDQFNDSHREMYREHFPDPFEVRYPNDCEIIVPNKMQRSYAEMIEMRLKNIGLRVDLLFPHDETPVAQVLEDISRRGCPYAIVILPQNEQHKSATVNILWGTAQEHRNMPLDDAMNLIARSFDTYGQTARDKVPAAVPSRSDPVLGRVPAPAEGSIQVLLNLLAEGRPLSVPEIDKIIRHLQDRRERLLQDTEIDHSQTKVATIQSAVAATTQPPSVPEQQAELQKRILSILNSGSSSASNAVVAQQTPSNANAWNANSQQPPPPPPAAAAAAANVPATVINFDNPNVQKALDNLIQSGPSLLRTLQATTVGNSANTSSNTLSNMGQQQQQHQHHHHHQQQQQHQHPHQQSQQHQLQPQHSQQHQLQPQQIPHQAMGNVGTRMNPMMLNQQRHPLLGTPTGNTAGMMGRNSMMGRY